MLSPASALLAGVLLGVGAAGSCFWTCASVMAPYLVSTEGEARGPRWSTVPGSLRALGWYQLGRLLAYLGAGVALALFAGARHEVPPALAAAAQLGTALLLARALLRGTRTCPSRHRRFGALLVGLLQGLAPCPPFLAAVGLGLAAEHPASGPLLFLGLFASTALFSLPLALLEPVRRSRVLSGLTRAAGAVICLLLAINALGACCG